MFLKHLKDKADRGEEEETNDMVITGLDGVSGHIVFSRYKDINIEEALAYFENGAFLSVGHAGFNYEVSGSIM